MGLFDTGIVFAGTGFLATIGAALTGATTGFAGCVLTGAGLTTYGVLTGVFAGAGADADDCLFF